MNWFLYDNGLRHESVNQKLHQIKLSIDYWVPQLMIFKHIIKSLASRSPYIFSKRYTNQGTHKQITFLPSPQY